jgi:LmbE family N-acetylglucosaminyl deacetylase
MHIVIFGAHPDDPESCCGGTIMRLIELGHRVTALYLTRGEAGIAGVSGPDAARIRTAEALAACELMGCEAQFFDLIDGQCHIDSVVRERCATFLAQLAPDVLFTHWPIDTHRDHQVCALLAYEYWARNRDACDLIYFEAMLGLQTTHFQPTHYVDITAFAERRYEACLLHTSQNIASYYANVEGRMMPKRGAECGCPLAEAYVWHQGNHANKAHMMGVFVAHQTADGRWLPVSHSDQKTGENAEKRPASTAFHT